MNALSCYFFSFPLRNAMRVEPVGVVGDLPFGRFEALPENHLAILSAQQVTAAGTSRYPARPNNRPGEGSIAARWFDE